LIEVDEDKVVFGELNPFISSFNTNDIRHRGFNGSDEPGWKYWNIDSMPGQRI